MSEIQVRRATDDSRPAWDAYVAARPEADILQTWAWGDVQGGVGERPVRLIVRDGEGAVRGVAQALVRPTTFSRTVLYVPHGPVWDREAGDGDIVAGALLRGLRRLAREEKGIVVKVDPRGDGLSPEAGSAVAALLRADGLRPARHNLQAPTTRIVDLQGGGDALRKSWDKDARNLVRRSAKEGVETDVQRAPDREAIAIFHGLLEATAERADFRSHSLEFLADLAERMTPTGGWYLTMARVGDTPIGGMVALRVADRAYYLYGASTRDPAFKNANAGYATMAATMDALAADGVQTLDLWGVAEPDDDAPGEWAGFSAFKRRFGGRPVRHIGTFDLVADRAWFTIRDLRERLRGGGMTEFGLERALVAAEPAGGRPLGELIERLVAEGRLNGAREGGRAIGAAALAGLEVRGVAYDSRKVGPGSLFVAVPGAHVDGHDFLASAGASGAVAAIVERTVEGSDLPQLLVNQSQPSLATAAAWWYGDPSRELVVVGITGTDGKTTTSFLAVAALEAAGLSSGLIGTVDTRIGGVQAANREHATTPEAPELQRSLRAMALAGDQLAVVETTSHGLALERVGGIAYDAAMLTNLTHEHLEFHGTWERYRDAKLSLFERLAVGAGQSREDARRSRLAEGRHRQRRRPLGRALCRRRPGGRCPGGHLRDRSGGRCPGDEGRGGRGAASGWRSPVPPVNRGWPSGWLGVSTSTTRWRWSPWARRGAWTGRPSAPASSASSGSLGGWNG